MSKRFQSKYGLTVNKKRSTPSNSISQNSSTRNKRVTNALDNTAIKKILVASASTVGMSSSILKTIMTDNFIGRAIITEIAIKGHAKSWPKGMAHSIAALLFEGAYEGLIMRWLITAAGDIKAITNKRATNAADISPIIRLGSQAGEVAKIIANAVRNAKINNMMAVKMDLVKATGETNLLYKEIMAVINKLTNNSKGTNRRANNAEWTWEKAAKLLKPTQLFKEGQAKMKRDKLNSAQTDKLIKQYEAFLVKMGVPKDIVGEAVGFAMDN
jgi:hypothetical protein